MYHSYKYERIHKACADSFDAMVAERPYKPALKREDAIDEIRKKTGTQFDAAVVEAFMEVVA